MVDPTPVPTSRAEQRRQTESRILAAARSAFAESGYDRTTIRAIASAAGVNAGLVMHYYGSKEQLFSEATKADPDEPISGTPDQIAEQLLASLRDKLIDEPDATLAMLRSMLTHPEANANVRASMNRQQRQLGETLTFDEDEALLRTGLTGAISLGVIVGRYLLELDGLRDAPPERIVELLRPCVRSLTRPRRKG